MVAEIPLTKGYVALVDDEDYERVAAFRWCVLEHGNGQRYALREQHVPGSKPRRKLKIYMHRLIIDAPAGLQVDHANRNGLDNRRANIRVCTSSQNNANRISRTRGGKSASRYRWVVKAKWGGWNARVGGRHVGYFTSDIEAALAADEAAKRIFGEFARLNFPNQSNTPHALDSALGVEQCHSKVLVVR